MPKRAILFLAWGDKYVAEVLACLARSRLPAYPRFLITDRASRLDQPPPSLHVVRAEFVLDGLARKAELIDHLPREYESFLFLDTDTTVLDDIEFGFQKAELHGIAVAPAPHYSLDCFWGFDRVMREEGVAALGQLQYNTGVMFFSPNDRVIQVFQLWKALAVKFRNFRNDQPFLSLAMEELAFNPYTLSIGYNYRGMGQLISGAIRIWHSTTPLPEDINRFTSAWPPRRVVNGKVVYPQLRLSALLAQARGRLGHISRRLINRRP